VTHSLRDVLNAAWLTRLEVPESIREVEEAALAASIELLDSKADERGEVVPGVGAVAGMRGSST
jgi:hypothetical protein